MPPTSGFFPLEFLASSDTQVQADEEHQQNAPDPGRNIRRHRWVEQLAAIRAEVRAGEVSGLHNPPRTVRTARTHRTPLVGNQYRRDTHDHACVFARNRIVPFYVITPRGVDTLLSISSIAYRGRPSPRFQYHPASARGSIRSGGSLPWNAGEGYTCGAFPLFSPGGHAGRCPAIVHSRSGDRG